MHEAGLMRDLMAKILGVAAKEAGNKVSTVTVWLGALSHMTAEHFRDHYDQAAAGTIASDAALHIELSDDIQHPDAQHVILKSVGVSV